MRDRLVELIGDLPFSTEYERYNSLEWAEHFADYLLANGVIVLPCKVGQTVYKIRKFCETNTGYKEFYIPTKEFEEDCPYLEPQSWYDDCDICKAVTDYDEACYCTVNLKILSDTCESRLAIQKDKFTWSMICNIFNTPMFDTNTDLYDTYFLTREEAEQAMSKCVTDTNVGDKLKGGVEG